MIILLLIFFYSQFQSFRSNKFQNNKQTNRKGDKQLSGFFNFILIDFFYYLYKYKECLNINRICLNFILLDGLGTKK